MLMWDVYRGEILNNALKLALCLHLVWLANRSGQLDIVRGRMFLEALLIPQHQTFA